MPAAPAGPGLSAPCCGVWRAVTRKRRRGRLIAVRYSVLPGPRYCSCTARSGEGTVVKLSMASRGERRPAWAQDLSAACCLDYSDDKPGPAKRGDAGAAGSTGRVVAANGRAKCAQQVPRPFKSAAWMRCCVTSGADTETQRPQRCRCLRVLRWVRCRCKPRRMIKVPDEGGGRLHMLRGGVGFGESLGLVAGSSALVCRAAPAISHALPWCCRAWAAARVAGTAARGR